MPFPILKHNLLRDLSAHRGELIFDYLSMK